ncbi:MAG TPA: helix-turn-helix domain-containing protein [Candidatus Saccharimonadales bacterium]|nr:helix-turn-helix domain-containing protein [Candidatus Saccharimonadales bacterium]
MKIKRPFSCGLGPAFDLVGGRWKAIILWELSQQELRFSELRERAEGITEKMLLQQLREMERHGLIERHDYNEKPLRVGYRLTNEGRIVNELLIPLAEWGKEYAYRIDITGNYVHAD